MLFGDTITCLRITLLRKYDRFINTIFRIKTVFFGLSLISREKKYIIIFILVKSNFFNSVKSNFVFKTDCGAKVANSFFILFAKSKEELKRKEKNIFQLNFYARRN